MTATILPGRRSALALLVLAACASGAAAGPMPLPDGTYCGPNAATIGIDSKTDTVTIAGYSCTIPVFAADKLQSIQCHINGSPPLRREFDVRVLNDAMLYNGDWFVPCRH